MDMAWFRQMESQSPVAARSRGWRVNIGQPYPVTAPDGRRGDVQTAKRLRYEKGRRTVDVPRHAAGFPARPARGLSGQGGMSAQGCACRIAVSLISSSLLRHVDIPWQPPKTGGPCHRPRVLEYNLNGTSFSRPGFRINLCLYRSGRKIVPIVPTTTHVS